MDLDEFIESVLVNVLKGITSAQKADDVGAFVVPGGDDGHEYPKNARCSSSARLKSTIIDFDVAVTVESGDKTTGGGGLRIAGIGAKLEGEISSKDKKLVASNLAFLLCFQRIKGIGLKNSPKNKMLNKVVKFTPPLRGCAGQIKLRSICPLPRR